MTKQIVLALVLAGLLLSAAQPAVAAADDQEKERNWALGWEDALVLRRQLGLWHVGVSAGPNDRLSDGLERAWYVDEPDSLQGRTNSDRSDRRESGFVALELGGRVAEYRNFALAATAGVRYGWADSRWEDSYGYMEGEDQPYNQVVYDRFESWWGSSLALRLSWRPVPFIGIEAHYGLIYEWYDKEETRWSRRPGETDWDRRESVDHYKTFNDFGFYNLTDLAIMVWF